MYGTGDTDGEIKEDGAVSCLTKMTGEQFRSAKLTIANELQQSKERGDRCWHRAWAMVTMVEHTFCHDDYILCGQYVWDYINELDRFKLESD
jgi:hypothetical protein